MDQILFYQKRDGILLTESRRELSRGLNHILKLPAWHILNNWDRTDKKRENSCLYTVGKNLKG
jgi:hypothetical protein